MSWKEKWLHVGVINLFSLRQQRLLTYCESLCSQASQVNDGRLNRLVEILVPCLRSGEEAHISTDLPILYFWLCKHFEIVPKYECFVLSSKPDEFFYPTHLKEYYLPSIGVGTIIRISVVSVIRDPERVQKIIDGSSCDELWSALL